MSKENKPAAPVTATEELDAVLHWREKHATAIKERNALHQRLNAADQRNDDRAGTCEWSREEDSGIWNSGCGETWSFHEDGRKKTACTSAIPAVSTWWLR